MISSRTPEGPLNFCPVCGTHCRIEPALLTQDAVCPRCGSLLWFSQANNAGLAAPQRLGTMQAQSSEAARYWQPWTWSMLGSTAPLVVTPEEIRDWERAFGVQLPRSLARALTTQNGGRLLGTEVDIYPLGQFGTLNQGPWAELALAELPDKTSRDRMIRVGVMPGGTVVLDYRHLTEPSVRNMDHIFDGDVRAEYASLDLLVRSSQRQRVLA